MRVALHDALGHPSATTLTGSLRPGDIHAALSGTTGLLPSITPSVMLAPEGGDGSSSSSTQALLTVPLSFRGDFTFSVTVLNQDVLLEGSATPPPPVTVHPRVCGNTSTPSASGDQCVCNSGYQPLDLAVYPDNPTCGACPAGHVKPGVSNSPCTMCLAGTFANSSHVPCAACQPGAVSPAGADVCSSCGNVTRSGQAPSVALDACQCQPGWWREVLDGVRGGGGGGGSGGSGGATLSSTTTTSTTTTSFRCHPCPAGQVQPDLDAPACVACAAGTAPNANRTVCAVCPTAMVSGAGFARCMSCSLGMYVDLASATCQPCPHGSFADAPDATTCSPCHDGHVTLAQQSTVCEPCPNGTFVAAGANVCRTCAAGTWSPAGAQSCRVCDAGAVTVPAALKGATKEVWHGVDVGATECERCPAGTHADADQNVCTPCVGGTTSSSAGATSCSPCPAGEVTLSTALTNNGTTPTWYGVELGPTECVACPAGTYAMEGQNTCGTCPAGTTSSGTGATSCSPCPAGEVTLSTALTNNGTTPMWYGVELGPTECVACPAGTYAMEGQNTCGSCAAGTTSSGTGATACSPCADGEVTLSMALTNNGTTPTWYGVELGPTQCVACPAGTRNNKAVDQNVCTTCPAGTTSATGATSCSPCPAGEVTLSMATTHNDTTISTWYGVELGPTECVACPAGTYAMDGQNTCAACPGGTFSRQGTAGQCQLCDHGHITVTHPENGGETPNPNATIEDEWYGVAIGPVQCFPCNASTYASLGVECRGCDFNEVSGDAAPACTPCPAGTWASDGLTCHGCPPGTFQPGKGKQCESCAPGRINADWNRTSCVACEVGTVPNAARTMCELCPPGSVALSNVECKLCDLGFVNNDPLQRTCTKCTPGTIAGQRGMATCQVCPQGFFASAHGLDTCTLCPPNTFSTEGSAECLECPGDGDDSSGVDCNGGSVIFSPGFWRPAEQVSTGVDPTSVFHKCPDGACITNETSGEVECAPGHTGPLCSLCQQGWALAGETCTQCWSQGLSWSATALAVAVIVSALVVMVKRQTGRRNEIMAIGRILLNWVQLTAAIGTFALRAPALARDMLNLSSAADGVSLNAFFVQVHLENKEAKKNATHCCLLVFCCFVFACFWCAPLRVQCAIGFDYYSLFYSYCAVRGWLRVFGRALFSHCSYSVAFRDCISLCYDHLAAVWYTAPAIATIAISAPQVASPVREALHRYSLYTHDRLCPTLLFVALSLFRYIDYFKMSSTVMIVIVYIKVSREVLAVFELYTPQINDKWLLKADMSITALTPEHMLAMVFGFIMIVIFIFGVPLATAAFLAKQKRKIMSGSQSFRRKSVVGVVVVVPSALY